MRFTPPLSGGVPNKMGEYPAYQAARNSSNSRATRSCILYALNVSRPLSSVVGREIPLEECSFVVPIAPQALTAFNPPLFRARPLMRFTLTLTALPAPRQS